MKRDYALITAAYNEEAFIQNTIESVLHQSIQPKLWLIISDCSNDRTDEIIKDYTIKYSYIKYLRRNDAEKKKHNFSAKVHALNYGLSHIELECYNYLGILDADIILPENYYETLIDKMEKDEKLGLIGGSVYEVIGKVSKLHDISNNTVCGAVQFFRIDCFKEALPILPMPYGGEDSMLCVKSNYMGWNVKTYPEIKTQEQKFVGRAQKSIYHVRYIKGQISYDMGYLPIFFLFKCLYRVTDRPFLLGSFCELWGYIHLALKKTRRNAPPDLVAFLRRQQIKRLLELKSYRG